jgi:hypothetical protein
MGFLANLSKERVMTDQSRTGGVTAKGKVSARRIITGVEIEGAASDAVLKAALEMMDRLSTGGVSGAQVEASQDIVTGFRYLNPQKPERAAFVAELKELRGMLAELHRQPGAPAEAEAAARSLDDAIAEAEKKEPLGKLVVKRLHDTLEFITDAGKVWEAADKAGPLIAKTLPTAVALYQIAQALF